MRPVGKFVTHPVATAAAERRYVVGDTVPKSVGRGRILIYNRLRRWIDQPCGVNGFRAWTDATPPSGFKRCGCGWSGLAQYSPNPEYICEPREVIEDD
jgi:hypothetical protein